MRSLLLAFLLVPVTSIANDMDAGHAFAREMLACGHRHVIAGLGPGDATVAEQAQRESAKYFDAAAKATSETYVAGESEAIKKSAFEEFMAKLQSGGSMEDVYKWLAESDRRCDASLKTFSADAAPSKP